VTPVKIGILTGTRAEYGLFRALLGPLEREPRFETSLIVTGSHLSSRFGMTVEEIESDGHRIAARVPLPLDDDSELGVSRAMASALAGIAEALRDDRPDLLLILGDRYEALAGACAALLTRVPVAHLHGGELSEGAVDDAMRHAITKMAWLHFAATEASGRRIVQLGEEPSRVFVVGALGVDNALREATLTRAELEAELGPVFGARTALVTFHPVTGEDHSSAGQMAELLAALDRCRDLHAVFTMPNADAGNAAIVVAIQDYCRVNPDRAHAFVSLGTRRYLSLLACADVCLGNSSSGIIEAPSLGTPTVDIGDRQAGRERADCVFHCEPEAEAIEQALRRALSIDIRRRPEIFRNPYGDGHAAGRIVAVLRSQAPPIQGSPKRFRDIPAHPLDTSQEA
jgi:GDP/UDP-N,N'-diacetylbacillosamine 2-epimerase (hydrolysing)